MNKNDIEKLYKQVMSKEINFGDDETILTIIYNCYLEHNKQDDEKIKADFKNLYEKLNGKSLTELDEVIDPVSLLCYDHERFGFVTGIKLGMLLANELNS